MKKVAIIDTLGAHGGGFHFYTFGQSMGLIHHGFDVSLYTNNETTNPKINKLKFFTFYKNIFKSKLKIINGLRWIIGSLLSIFVVVAVVVVIPAPPVAFPLSISSWVIWYFLYDW